MFSVTNQGIGYESINYGGEADSSGSRFFKGG